MTTSQEYKIVSIIDEYRVVINFGSRDGARVGQRLLLYGVADSVTDPDSGEDLGVVEIRRGVGEIEHVQEKMSSVVSVDVGVTRKRVRKNLTGMARAIAPWNSSTPDETVAYEDIKPFGNARIGDHVRLLQFHRTRKLL